MSHKLLAPLLAFSLLTPTATSAADAQFTYHARELASTESARAMYTRLTQNVERACTDSGFRSVAQKRLERECIAALKAQYVEKIDNPRLTRLHHLSGGDIHAASD